MRTVAVDRDVVRAQLHAVAATASAVARDVDAPSPCSTANPTAARLFSVALDVAIVACTEHLTPTGSGAPAVDVAVAFVGARDGRARILRAFDDAVEAIRARDGLRAAALIAAVEHALPGVGAFAPCLPTLGFAAFVATIGTGRTRWALASTAPFGCPSRPISRRCAGRAAVGRRSAVAPGRHTTASAAQVGRSTSGLGRRELAPGSRGAHRATRCGFGSAARRGRR